MNSTPNLVLRIGEKTYTEDEFKKEFKTIQRTRYKRGTIMLSVGSFGLGAGLSALLSLVLVL